FVQLRAPAPRVFANTFKAQLQQAKFEAVSRNAPVAVVWDSVASAFETRFDSSLLSPCAGSTVIARNQASEYGRLNVTSTMGPGVVWMPNGQGVTCTNSASIGSVTTISDGRSTRTVTVHLGGGVEIQ